MLVLLIVLVLGSTIWVGFDASGRDWSDNPHGHNVAEWVAACLLLWIVAFPIYLSQRSRVPLRERREA
jgi:hypothetical protein